MGSVQGSTSHEVGTCWDEWRDPLTRTVTFRLVIDERDAIVMSGEKLRQILAGVQMIKDAFAADEVPDVSR